MVFDGIFSFAGNDDDVLDSGSDALFGNVLNLWLVDDGEHFFRLRLGGGEEARAESRGSEDGFADFVAASNQSMFLHSNGARWVSLYQSGCPKKGRLCLRDARQKGQILVDQGAE